jgi:hypothetical protein
VRLNKALAVSCSCAAFALTACPKQPPIVSHQTYATASGLFRTVAVVPFHPSPSMPRAAAPGAVSAADAADLLARFAAEAIGSLGVSVIPASDVALAFEASGQVVPRGDAGVAAALAAQKFGATAVVLGELLRYREREGGPSGAFRPASVAFVLTLYTAPAGQRVFSARFDETQPSLTENVVRAREYPGRGTRWLTAAELARFGIARAIDAVPRAMR